MRLKRTLPTTVSDGYRVTHLVRFASTTVAKDVDCVVVDVEVPLIHEIDMLPEKVGCMAVKASRDEGGFFEVGSGQEAKYEL